MSKFENFINEAKNNELDSIIAKIRKDSKPWLNAIKRCSQDKALWRSVSNTGRSPTIYKKVRQDRRPLSSSEELHQVWDDSFDMLFGWRARSTAMFASPQFDSVIGYGDEEYLVFPKGNFKFIWSEKMDDMSTDFPLGYDEDFTSLSYNLKKIKELYTDKNLCKALAGTGEIMVKTGNYYGISINLLRDWAKAKKMSDDPQKVFSDKIEDLGNKFITTELL